MTPILLHQHALRRRKATAVQSTAIDRIANRLEPQMRKRFLAAVQSAKGKVDLSALANAIQAGSVSKAELAVKVQDWPKAYKGMSVDLIAGFEAGIDVANHAISSGAIRMRLDLINPYAVTYAERTLPKIVSFYMEHGRENIRSIISEAVSGKYTAQSAAVAIRDSIGLTPQYERATNKYRLDLIAEGLSGERLETKVDRYAHKLLNTRAKTISRTEIIRAEVAGQKALWNEAARSGVFDKEKARRVWKTHFDERTCELCSVMDGQSIGYGEWYDHPDLGSVDVFGEPLELPHLHPNCLVFYGTPVYTVEGWKRIVDVKVGDLVMTHKGRFKPVIQIHRHSATDDTVKLKLHNSRHALPLTKNHPVLTGDNRWVNVAELKIGDTVQMLAVPCAYCGKPCLSEYCGNSCSTRGVKKWVKANEGCRRRVQDGVFVLQRPETKIAANRKLALNARSGSWLERRLGWAMSQVGLAPVRCHPIPKTERDKLGRQRHWFTDFAFPELRIVIECDGEAWHKNIERDRLRQADIESQGWTVMRFPESRLNSALTECAQEVARLAANHAHSYVFGSVNVVSVSTVKRTHKYTTYNLSVEDDESFIANGVVVHNCRCYEILDTSGRSGN